MYIHAAKELRYGDVTANRTRKIGAALRQTSARALRRTGQQRAALTMPMLSKDGAASSIQARMRGRAERKANAAKAKAEEKAEKAAAAAAAAESKSEQEEAATKMQATIRGRAARKAEAAKAQQAAEAAGGSDQAPAPKKKSFFAKADGGVHVVDGSADTPRRRSTCAPYVADA